MPKDAIEENEILKGLIELLENQTVKGIKKYGHTVKPSECGEIGWINHLQQELLDALVYMESFKKVHENGSMDELINKVKAWAVDRNLHTANPRDQFLKVIEEVGEVAAALARGDEKEVEDGIGDTFVTLIIFAMQQGLDATKCLQVAYDEIKDRRGRMVDGIFVKEEDL